MHESARKVGLRTPEAEIQSEVARARAQKAIKVTRIGNGYLISPGGLPDTEYAPTREVVHAKLDEFFDRVERSDELPTARDAASARQFMPPRR